MKTKHIGQSGLFDFRAVLIYAAAGSIAVPIISGLAFVPSETSPRLSHPAATGLTFAERVAYQRAIEDVYWRHRIWPQENRSPKPSLDAVMPHARFETKVADYLRKSQALEDYWQQPARNASHPPAAMQQLRASNDAGGPITARQLQAEMDRMARHTKQPEVLRELFAALGNDPFVIAECLARQVLVERLVSDLTSSADRPSFRAKSRNPADLPTGSSTGSFGVAQDDMSGNLHNVTYKLPEISTANGCMDDTWTATTTTNAPAGRYYFIAVWTGSEMIVWGGYDHTNYFNTGGRYNPSTDSWTATSLANAPDLRDGHTAVWTGTEMIVWGGNNGFPNFFNTGGRYNPGTDSWTVTSTTNAPSGRTGHTAVWTGSEMIVWGGYSGNSGWFNTGGRYNPDTDSWTGTSTTGAPSARFLHTAVWTGSEMIVWGGNYSSSWLNTGGKYDAGTDSWTATTATNAPDGRAYHTTVWTGGEMIVWGGWIGGTDTNTGGRYNPSIDSWSATSISNAPDARYSHAAVWTGSEMIVWGGWTPNSTGLNTGGRYNPKTEGWTATSTTNAPDHRFDHTATWTGSEMIVWGGRNSSGDYLILNTGGRYCAQSGGTATPTPTVTATSTPTPTPTGTATSTPTLTPQPTVTPSEAPCAAGGSEPACNSTVFTEKTAFYVYITGFIGSLPPPSVFTVNGIPANNVSGGGSTLEFYFNASPVIPGQNTMNIPPGAFTCSNSGRPFEGFHCTFTYQASTPTPTQPPPSPTATATSTATPTLTPRASPTPRTQPTPRVRPTPPPRP